MKQDSTKKQNVVKNYIKAILPIMVCLMMVYTSCRKVENAPAPTSTKPTNDALSGQIAVNLSKSLAGSFGGVNLNDGVDSVSVADHLGPHHACSCTKNTLCGFFTDSLVNYNATIGDTVVHTGGHLKFYFNCIDGKLSGYTASDSLNTVKTVPGQAPQIYKVQQDYTIQALDDQHEFIGVNGNNWLTTSDGGSYYVLSNLKIDLTNKDILSGTATFKAWGNTWGEVTGTITFLGNHMADVVMNGKTYHANLLTGKVS
jgi:hypothetical protein